MRETVVFNGVDVLLANGNPRMEGLRLGVITNHTGVTKGLTSTVDALIKAGYAVRALFGAEHGMTGAAQDGVAIETQVDRKTGLPVYSLYGGRLKPTLEMLAGLDALVFDMQDVGVRFYTYLYTLAYAIAAAAEHDLAFFVLDRPNPIRGDVVEGGLLDPAMRSSVGDYGLPFRTGLTPGEFARYVNDVNGWNADLEVISLRGWKRSMWFEETDLPWVLPSPNLPTLASAVVYPGTVLFEGTNCSEGRGTGQPFELIGAPWLDGEKTTRSIRAQFAKLGIEGVGVREASFIPTASKHAGMACSGFQLHVSNRDAYEPVSAAIVCLKAIRDLHPTAFEWRVDVGERMAVDRLAGTTALRVMIDSEAPFGEILTRMTSGLDPYLHERAKHLMYSS